MGSAAFRTDESSVMLYQDAFLMSIDGVKDLFLSIFFDVGMERSTFTAVAMILYP